MVKKIKEGKKETETKVKKNEKKDNSKVKEEKFLNKNVQQKNNNN